MSFVNFKINNMTNTQRYVHYFDLLWKKILFETCNAGDASLIDDFIFKKEENFPIETIVEIGGMAYRKGNSYFELRAKVLHSRIQELSSNQKMSIPERKEKYFSIIWKELISTSTSSLHDFLFKRPSYPFPMSELERISNIAFSEKQANNEKEKLLAILLRQRTLELVMGTREYMKQHKS